MANPGPGRRFPSRIHPESSPFSNNALRRCDVCKRWQAWGTFEGRLLCRRCLIACGGADTGKHKPRKKPEPTTDAQDSRCNNGPASEPETGSAP